MPISVTCPNCLTTLKAPDQAAGRRVKCPKCTTSFGVPAPGAEPAIKRPGAPVPHPLQPITVAPVAEEEFDVPRPTRRRAAAPVAAPATGAQLGLGIASLAVGIIGAVLAFIPCLGLFIGLPIAGVGLLLGIAALIVAFTRGGQAIAFPISGAAVSFVGVIVPLVWWFVWVRPAMQQTAQTVQAFQQMHGAQLDMMQKMAKDFGKDFGEQARRQAEEARKVQQQAFEQKKPPVAPPGFNPNPPVAPPGPAQPLAVGQSVNDRLTQNDLKDRHRNVPSKTYTVKLQAGKTYQIDMASKEVDSYLRLEDAGGLRLAENDDFGNGLDSRIVFPCPRDGDYRVVAMTLPGALPPTGNFTLTVQQK
jgi:hypothetical protein